MTMSWRWLLLSGLLITTTVSFMFYPNSNPDKDRGIYATSIYCLHHLIKLHELGLSTKYRITAMANSTIYIMCYRVDILNWQFCVNDYWYVTHTVQKGEHLF